jgi:hypothetical protein
MEILIRITVILEGAVIGSYFYLYKRDDRHVFDRRIALLNDA